MLLELYDMNHRRIAGLKNHKDAMVESELSTGDKTLSFLWHSSNSQKIPHEYYIRTDKDEFVVKENAKNSDHYRKITAKLNIEEIEGRAWQEFIIEGVTAQEAADYALTDTGWTCVSTVPADRVRNISLKKVSSYQVMEKILDAFTCEVSYDTFHKIVYLKEQVGADKGAYFIDGLNLKELTDESDSYDFATIIVPIGADELSIESVNGGKNYLENYQYSSKKKTLIWEDSNYTDAQALMEDAQYKLNEISKPRRTLRAKTIDLAKLSKKYSALEYEVGDTVTVVSNKDGIREKQRITKTTEYLEAPQNNTCDISNSVLSFEDLQAKLFAAAECIGNITTDNGTVKGSSVDKIDVTQIIGLERYVSEDVDDLKVNHLYARTDFGTPYAVIGQAVMTQGQATNLKVTGRMDLAVGYITELHADKLEGDTAVFKTIESDNIAALEARIDKITSTDITTEYLEAHYAQIDMANVDTAVIRQGFLEKLMVSQGIIADRVVGTEVVATDVLTGVKIYADDITAGTLSVDRLVLRGTEKSLVYALNNSGELQSTQVDTLDAYILTDRTITADKIVAGSITADEIASGAITANEIAANAITAAKIDAGAVTAVKIASGAITADKIAAGAVTAEKLAAEAVTADKICVTDLSAIGATIGGWGINSTNIVKYSTVTEGTASSQYRTYLSAPATTIGSTAAIVVQERTYDGASSYGDWKNNFYVRYNGYMCAVGGGRIGGWDIGSGSSGAIYKGCNSMASTTAGTYIGTDGIRNYKNANTYVDIQDGVLSCKGAEVRGDIYCDADFYMFLGSGFQSHGVITEPGYYKIIKANDNNGIISMGLNENDSYLSFGRYDFVLKAGGVNVMRGFVDAHVIISPTVEMPGGIAGNLSISGDVNASKGNFSGITTITRTTDGTALRLKHGTKYYWDFRLYDTGGFFITSYDSAGINQHALQLNPDKNYFGASNTYDAVTSYVRGATVRLYAHTGGGVYLGSSGSTAVTSDENLKDLYELSESYDVFYDALAPKIYKYKKEGCHRFHAGFGARQVEQALLDAGLSTEDFAGILIDKDVTIGADEAGTDEDVHYDELYSLRYEEFISLNTWQIQKLKQKVSQQAETIQKLSEMVGKLQSAM